MTNSERSVKFTEIRKGYRAYVIDDKHIEIHSTEDAYNDGQAEPSEEDYSNAHELAKDCGMRLTTGHHTTWQGWSEYTPDPGDVAIFYWEPDDE